MKHQENNSRNDLSSKQAVEKMKELVKHNRICFFTTDLGQQPLQTRPMSVQEVDEEGNFWFLSGRTSHKNLEIGSDPRVQLLFANQGDSEFLSVYGEAKVYADAETIEEIWNPIAKVWFPEGKYDPEITVIKVSTMDAYYWDTKHSKMVALVKMAAALVSGTTMDDGQQGTLRVR